MKHCCGVFMRLLVKLEGDIWLARLSYGGEDNCGVFTGLSVVIMALKWKIRYYIWI